MSDPFAPRSKNVQIDLAGLSVFIGIPAGRDLPVLTVKSLLATQDICRANNVPCQFGMVAGSAVVQWARDEVVDLFLKSDATRLFWIDSDMVWKPEDFMRMLALSQHHDVVCATYPAKTDVPTFYVNRDEAKPLIPNEWGLVEIWGVGLGFTVVSREAMEVIAAAAPDVHDEAGRRALKQVFRIGQIESGGRLTRQGEDMAFFHDLRAAGYQVFLDRDIDLGHIGTKQYTGTIRDALACR